MKNAVISTIALLSALALPGTSVLAQDANASTAAGAMTSRLRDVGYTAIYAPFDPQNYYALGCDI